MTTISTNFPTQILHTSYMEKNGFTWRKRYSGTTLSISLLTHDYQVGRSRAASITIKFLECQPIGMVPNELQQHLKHYRDFLIREEKIDACRKMFNPTVTTPQEELLPSVASFEAVKHSFEEAK
ncbi:hypothetical protein [Kluyvera genomosp. 3]|uniref:Uncharacterized protein n=1 Tax=Kluyvera genomosp. 3 TaxID=2774055 RepID=A0A6G9RN61_9ENTR|nr:hypothetical protein [Kluyvera genomosp. 3]QIR27733.1 hypothetical protein GY169_13375 [Kluyvera genomosp. 3]